MDEKVTVETLAKELKRNDDGSVVYKGQTFTSMDALLANKISGHNAAVVEMEEVRRENKQLLEEIIPTYTRELTKLREEGSAPKEEKKEPSEETSPAGGFGLFIEDENGEIDRVKTAKNLDKFIAARVSGALSKYDEELKKRAQEREMAANIEVVDNWIGEATEKANTDEQFNALRDKKYLEALAKSSTLLGHNWKEFFTKNPKIAELTNENPLLAMEVINKEIKRREEDLTAPDTFSEGGGRKPASSTLKAEELQKLPIEELEAKVSKMAEENYRKAHEAGEI